MEGQPMDTDTARAPDTTTVTATTATTSPGKAPAVLATIADLARQGAAHTRRAQTELRAKATDAATANIADIGRGKRPRHFDPRATYPEPSLVFEPHTQLTADPDTEAPTAFTELPDPVTAARNDKPTRLVAVQQSEGLTEPDPFGWDQLPSQLRSPHGICSFTINGKQSLKAAQ